MLEVSHLTAGYGKKHILKDVSFSLGSGQVLALIGPNGSGKTTLVRCISGVLPIESGVVRVTGRDTRSLAEQDRAKLMAVVPQVRTLPAAFSAREVVALGRTPYLNWLGQLSEVDMQVIDRSLQQVNMSEFVERNVSELSGGEQQRLFLARALAQETPLLLMDEPTAHLDLQHQVSLMRLIHRMAHPPAEDLQRGAQPKAILVILHDLNLLSRYTDRVGLLLNGELKLLGTPQEVLHSDALRQAYQLDLRVIRDAESGTEVVVPLEEI